MTLELFLPSPIHCPNDICDQLSAMLHLKLKANSFCSSLSLFC